MEYVFLAAACVSVLCVALICAFLLANGLPAMGEIGVLKFLSGTRWKPGADIYGIFPMIVGSVYVTAGALLLGVPVALLTAVYLAFFCPKGLYRVLKPAVELLAGIPSVVISTFLPSIFCSTPVSSTNAPRVPEPSSREMTVMDLSALKSAQAVEATQVRASAASAAILAILFMLIFSSFFTFFE